MRSKRRRGNTLIDLAVAGMIAAVGVSLQVEYSNACIETGNKLKAADQELYKRHIEYLNLVRAQINAPALPTTAPDAGGNITPITSQ